MKRISFAISAMLILLSLSAVGQIIARQDITTNNLPDDNGLSAALPFLIPVQGISCQTFPSRVTFKLYPKETASSAVWQETQTVITVGGSYMHNALLGLTTNGLPVDVFSAGTALWLGVQCEGEPEAGRLMMSSAPYAIRSLDSANLGGRPATAYALADTVNTTAFTANLNNEIARAQMSEGNLVLDISNETTARQNAIAALQNSTQTTMVRTDQANVYTANTTFNGAPLVVQASMTPFGGTGWDALRAETNHPSGNGLEGVASSTTGQAWGVYGNSDSQNGSGVVGEANDATGTQVSYGVQGLAHSSQSIGVLGSSDWNSGNGTMIGVMGSVNHNSAVAGVFDNNSDGKVISGRRNGSETFSVSSNGVVTAASYQGDGSQLTGVATSSQIVSLNAAIAALQAQIAALQASNATLSAQVASLVGATASTVLSFQQTTAASTVVLSAPTVTNDVINVELAPRASRLSPIIQ